MGTFQKFGWYLFVIAIAALVFTRPNVTSVINAGTSGGARLLGAAEHG